MSIYKGGNENKGVDWSYYDKYDKIDDKYLPDRGEGENLAQQAITATAKLVYKWYNDGDVYDNQHGLDGWCNNLSSYANWLAQNIDGAKAILDRIFKARTQAQYEHILKDLTDLTNDEKLLAVLEKKPKQGTIYECEGDYKWTEPEPDEDDWC